MTNKLQKITIVSKTVGDQMDLSIRNNPKGYEITNDKKELICKRLEPSIQAIFHYHQTHYNVEKLDEATQNKLIQDAITKIDILDCNTRMSVTQEYTGAWWTLAKIIPGHLSSFRSICESVKITEYQGYVIAALLSNEIELSIISRIQPRLRSRTISAVTGDLSSE